MGGGSLLSNILNWEYTHFHSRVLFLVPKLNFKLKLKKFWVLNPFLKLKLLVLVLVLSSKMTYFFLDRFGHILFD